MTAKKAKGKGKLAEHKKPKTTRRKVKAIGQQDYINPNTGEIVPMQVVSVEERDANFHKIWMATLMSKLDIIGNQKTKLAFWIMDHLDKQNRLIATQRRISELTKISIKTVNDTLVALEGANFLVKVQAGVYQINPDIVFKGGKTDRMNVMIQYRDASANSSKEDKQLSNVLAKKINLLHSKKLTDSEISITLGIAVPVVQKYLGTKKAD